MTTHSLTNPGAETGDTTGWTNETGSLAVRSATPSPHSGSYYFYGGANLETKASQEVDLVADGVSTTDIDNGILTFIVSWYQTTYAGSDKAEIQIRFKDSSKVEIQTDSAGLTANTTQSWELRTFAPQIPANTRYIDIIMHMYRYSGTNNDGYIDDISASTEPSNCRLSQAVVEVIKEDELPKNARLSQAVVEVISLNITSTTTSPTTIAPTTLAPTTLPPTTLYPSTIPPTTLSPTTLAPTTLSPTTIPPTTLPSTTIAPTTEPPTLFETDFTEPSPLDDWSGLWYSADISLSIVAASHDARVGTSDLRFTGSNNSRKCAVYNPPGSSNDQEALCLLNISDLYSSNNYNFRLILRASGTDSNESGYFIDINPQLKTLTLNKYVSGSLTTLLTCTNHEIFSTDIPQWLRFKVSGTSLYFKTWTYNCYEPVEWHLSTTDTSLASGETGIGQYTSDIYDLMYFAVGINGTSPPIPILTYGTLDRLTTRSVTTANTSAVNYARIVPFRIPTIINNYSITSVRIYIETWNSNVRFALYKGTSYTDPTDATLVEDFDIPDMAVGWNTITLASPSQVSTGDVYFIGFKGNDGTSTVLYINSACAAGSQMCNGSGYFAITAGESTDETSAWSANLSGATLSQAAIWFRFELLLEDLTTTTIPTTSTSTTISPT